MVCSILSLGLNGIEPYLVSVEVDSRKGLPGFDLVGLPDASVKEARERVKSAIQNIGYPLPVSKIVANLAPADTKKAGSVYDLPILLALLCAAGYEQLNLDNTAVIGEIGLSGEIRGVPGVLPMVLGAAALGVRRVIVPAANGAEAAPAVGVEVYCAHHIRQVVDFLKGEASLAPATAAPPAPLPEAFPDFSDVKGQTEAKRAMEVAAAGGHNLLLIGPPGAGKSMLAARLPSILPDMTREEAVEVTKIHSVAGVLETGRGLLDRRPFRSPHHSVSPAALAGGGATIKPGDLSLAHNGVLFLDELPEFQKNSLEVLRQPLEDGKVSISRVRQRVSYPSKVMLVAAMNPCPCGYFGHPTKDCTCSPGAMQRYLGKVSGPLLDRIDIHVEVLPVSYSQMASAGVRQSSADIGDRVAKARQIQVDRYRGLGVACNAGLTAPMLDRFCTLEPKAAEMLKNAFDRLSLSARGYSRILKVARTIADLAGEESILAAHVSEAIQYRSLDRKYWGG